MSMEGGQSRRAIFKACVSLCVFCCGYVCGAFRTHDDYGSMLISLCVYPDVFGRRPSVWR
jgi:hypothetical protein